MRFLAAILLCMHLLTPIAVHAQAAVRSPLHVPLAEEQAKRQAAHAAALEAEQKRQQELAEAQAKTVADHARAKPENRKGRRSAQVILRAVRRASQDVPGSGQEPRQPAEQGPQGLEVLTC